ncbi:MAG: hypothetical protein JSS34_00995 [Proteobacteria bacterium]|nr:hypothetical protein [Pseudomonadota bacterium]
MFTLKEVEMIWLERHGGRVSPDKREVAIDPKNLPAVLKFISENKNLSERVTFKLIPTAFWGPENNFWLDHLIGIDKRYPDSIGVGEGRDKKKDLLNSFFYAVPQGHPFSLKIYRKGPLMEVNNHEGWVYLRDDSTGKYRYFDPVKKIYRTNDFQEIQRHIRLLKDTNKEARINLEFFDYPEVRGMMKRYELSYSLGETGHLVLPNLRPEQAFHILHRNGKDAAIVSDSIASAVFEGVSVGIALSGRFFLR